MFYTYLFLELMKILKANHYSPAQREVIPAKDSGPRMFISLKPSTTL